MKVICLVCLRESSSKSSPLFWQDLAPPETKIRARQILGGQRVREYRYDQVKALALVYQETKNKVAEHFRQMHYGGSRWLKMPPEVDQFSLLDGLSPFQSFLDWLEVRRPFT